MCRFVAYIGQERVLLNNILEKPKNSLINQSRAAKEGLTMLNADGFGFSWYDHTIDDMAAVFKSTLPAWNDLNLTNLASKIKTNCFIGHVRASTVGDVSQANCQPFKYQQYSFCHNGTIDNFALIKRKLCQLLDEDHYQEIRGQTDSEHFFALLMHQLSQHKTPQTVHAMAETTIDCIKQIKRLLSVHQRTDATRFNIAFTDGFNMIATRYISDTDKVANSLYYTVGERVNTEEGEHLMHYDGGAHKVICIASEMLNDYANEWKQIPVNHLLMVDHKLSISLLPIEV